MDVLRYAAFTDDPAGGNPAGIVLDAVGAGAEEMLAVAAEVGYAETALVVDTAHGAERRLGLRYFSPHAEVPFCGHATVATAVALAERLGAGAFEFDTPVGVVGLETHLTGGAPTASFTSVEPALEELPAPALDDLLDLLGIGLEDLDETHPPRIAAAGNPHPVLVLREAAVFDGFRFDPRAARQVLDAHGWPATVSVLHRSAPGVFEARNLFPVGSITEDPATGSAAAAFGGYLRLLGLVEPPVRITIHQGRHVGRPGTLVVDVPASGGIVVTGRAVPLD